VEGEGEGGEQESQLEGENRWLYLVQGRARGRWRAREREGSRRASWKVAGKQDRLVRSGHLNQIYNTGSIQICSMYCRASMLHTWLNL
jgi:hypothetical protein